MIRALSGWAAFILSGRSNPPRSLLAPLAWAAILIVAGALAIYYFAWERWRIERRKQA